MYFGKLILILIPHSHLFCQVNTSMAFQHILILIYFCQVNIEISFLFQHILILIYFCQVNIEISFSFFILIPPHSHSQPIPIPPHSHSHEVNALLIDYVNALDNETSLKWRLSTCIILFMRKNYMCSASFQKDVLN